MKLSDFFLLSFRSIRRRKLRSWLTMIGIFIGITAVVSLISLGQGLENVVVGQFSIAGSDVINVQAKGTGYGPPGSGVIEPLSDDELSTIRRVQEVDFAIGQIIEIGSVEFNDKIEYRYVGSFSGDDRQYDLINLKAEEGRLLKKSDTNKVTVGSEYADPDVFGKPVVIGSRILINGEYFQVIGIIEKRGSFVTDSTVTMPEDELRQLFDTEEDTYDAINLKVNKGVDIQVAKEKIETSLRRVRNVNIGEEDFAVETSDSIIKNLKSTLFAVQLFVYIIAGISIVVGGIGIMNTMYTSVLERTNDIGIMKAIGAKNETIFTLFFIESGILGSIGGIIGIILGVSVAKGLAYAGQVVLGSNLINAHIKPEIMIGALLFSFIVGTISGLAPAMRAAKLHPVEALRD